MRVAWPAGPAGSGAMPRSMPAARCVGTSQEPFDSMAAWPCSNASPISANRSGGMILCV